MKQFAQLLKRINDRLYLPQPTKSRIILEISADLEDLYQYYINKGFEETEAVKRAEEKFDLTDEALADLKQIHLSLLRRWMDRINEQTQTKWERGVLVFSFLFIILFGGQAIISTPFFTKTSKLVWPILSVFSSIMAISLIKFYHFYIKKDHLIKKLHNGMSSILVLGTVNLFIGVGGFLTELYLAGTNGLLFISNLCFLINTVGEESSKTIGEIVGWMLRSSSLVMICILCTIFTALLWYVLMNKISKIEQAEIVFLLNE